MASLVVEVRVRASRALSIPVAFIAAALLDSPAAPASNCPRSRPRVFFCAVFALPAFLVGNDASSSASSAAFSAFLRAASCALAAAASLYAHRCVSF
jgi:hypothetical protein